MSTSLYRQNFRLQRNILIGGLLLMGMKFAAWLLTNSNAILTDALESIINVVAGAFGLFSLSLSAKPRDLNHPYGHGKIEFISAGFEGGLIFLAGCIIVAKSTYNLLYPQTLTQLDIGLALVGVSGLVNYFMGALLVRRGRHSHSLIMIASGKHLQSDAYSSAGLLLGLILLLFTGAAWLDNLIAILFGFIILYTGFRLMRTSIAGIMDEADEQLISGIVEKLGKDPDPDWIDVHNFRVIKYGAKLHIDCHLTLPYYYDVERAHRNIKAFERAVATHWEGPVELFIHIDPCAPPAACRFCRKTDCAVRQAPFQHSVRWSLNNFRHNTPHYLEPDKSQSK